ncbi:hypothetical protein GP486_001603 [Trichoglossum hirsutum]|uniref:Kinesin light chain n=1 Tax=Trichoglossum hirsutum TaxID=265104 RepID=A0A9P8RSH5_9PEZI|nr:hypothetical protein GP486_001603 [Trichoglossum hirsutum]
MSEYLDLDDIFHFHHEGSELASPQPQPQTYPGLIHRRPHVNAGTSRQDVPSQEECLSFVQEQEWDPHKKYNADSSHYLLEWKARLNRKAFTTQTVPIVVDLDPEEKVLGEEHPSTLNSMNNLALVLRQQGKYEAAEKMHRRTLILRKKVLGEEHPSTLASMNNLAEMLRQQGNYEAAKKIIG